MLPKDLKVVFFGTPHFVIPIAEALYNNFNLTGVVTSQDKPVGRKQILTPSPIKTWAMEHQIPVFNIEEIDQAMSAQLFVVAAYGKIIPKSTIDIPEFGALNIHPSLLPKYRGPSPIQQTILNGDEDSGVTIIKLDEKMDHGPIVTAREIRLSHQDTFESLSTKMFDVSSSLLVKVIPTFIKGEIEIKEQNHTEATYTKIVTKEDGYFDINNPPPKEKLDRMIRAYYPWPTAWTRWEGKIVKFLPGTMIQMEGKSPIKMEDFLRGHLNFPLPNL